MTRTVLSQTEFRKKFEEYVDSLTPEQLKQHGEELMAFADKKVLSLWRKTPGSTRKQ